VNNLKSNKGFTLIELIVSIAILALLATAIIGILNSNTVIFRKSKADLSVQNTAQETYQKLSEEIMQAKYVYIEGYTTTSDVSFPTNKVGSSSSASFTPVKLLRQSDINLLDVAGATPIKTYLSDITNESTGESNAQAKLAMMTDENKKKFNSFYNSVRFMKEFEAEEYANFLTAINGLSTEASSFTPFTDSSLVTSVDNAGAVDITYGKVYVKKIIVQYAVPFDAKYGDRADLLDPGNTEKFPTDFKSNSDNDQYRKDYCRVTYEFDKNEMKVSYKYGAMHKLDTVVSDDSDVFSKSLNYVVAGGSSSTTNVPGVICFIDGNNDVIGLNMYFAERSMSYTDNGMIYMRNSYVLHDSK
jgi:prepilin-type N-terminal cleavage/methylation domain-containing protein